MEPSNRYLLSSVKNALRILQSFTLEEPEKSISELAKKLNVSKSGIRRLLTTLASEGFVLKNERTQKYRLGHTVLALSHVITTHLEIHREAWPVLEELVEKTGESAQIGVLEGTRLVYLIKKESFRPVRTFSRVGRSVPAYCTGGGKAILAFQDGETIEKVIAEGLVPYTERTITDPDMLVRHLNEIREQGYAVGMGELSTESEITSVAAPIRDYTGHVIASLTVLVPKYRIRPDNIPHVAADVMKAAAKISQKLGY